MTTTDQAGIAALPMPDLSRTFPGPFPTSPHAEDIQAHLGQWLDRFPLLSRPEARHILCDIVAHGVARTFPTAEADGLFLCADLFLWLTAFDDTYGEAAAAGSPARLARRIQGCVHLLGGGEVPGDAGAFDEALHDLLVRLRTRATAAQYLRITGCLRDALFGILWEAHQLADPGHVSMQDYRMMRPHTVLVRTLIAATEVVLRYELPEEARRSRAVQQLEAAVADLAGVLNDLGSYARESAKGVPDSLNLISLLTRDQHCDIPTAYAAASRLGEEHATTARRGIHALAAGDSAVLAQHARALESIACSYVWHIGHARYKAV
ncbi:terpene synthase family protein [Kitasatospora sp. DSM 101779]|uniref:terpene synthase family protein n=1 Tax=Kitasatospora sp. DSM 101779 TaxID=2853165 RepID=UPI0021DB493B|nr:terpene synthase family protein [Kitasatospora sp. DSM 101779]MCU7820174.1 terpene synthase family protein [Kitasatospora sp. DSM 101779]